MNENRHERRNHGPIGWKGALILAPLIAASAVAEAVKKGVQKIKGKPKK